MASSIEHQNRYAALRNVLLTRHVAGGAFFRHDLLAEDLVLSDATDRWSFKQAIFENPLLWGANLLTALGVEHTLGNPGALDIVERIVASIGALYRCTTPGFEGFPTRWDPVTSDLWDIAADGTLIRNRHFLLDRNGAFLTSLSTTDPRAAPYRPWSTLEKLLSAEQFEAYRNRTWWFESFHRRWEVSMDEVTGLVASYAILHDLFTETSPRVTALHTSVSDQAAKLADWLSRHAYLLVRPNKGFCARGAAGLLPAFEFPFRIAFMRITGMDVLPQSDIVEALDAAGVWSVLAGPVNRIVVAGTLGTIFTAGAVAAMIGGIAGALGPLGTALLGQIGLVGAGATTAAIASHPSIATAVAQVSLPEIWRCAALYLHSDCFDVWHYADEQWRSIGPEGEFALAAALHAIEIPASRFTAAFGTLPFISKDSPPNAFPPFVGLAASNDVTVRAAYLDWFDTWRADGARPPEATGPDSAFSAAVALDLDPTPARERELLRRLDETYDSTAAELPLEIRNDESLETIGNALDYVSALALAWRHAKARRDAGAAPGTTGFPEAPAPAVWTATIPVTTFDTHSILRGTIANPIVTTGVVDVFSEPALRRPASVTAPLPASGPLLFDGHVLLPRSHSQDIDTGISLRWGDEWELECVRTTGRGIGPDGSGPVDDVRYPLHIGLDPNATYHAALARLNGYVMLGMRRDRERWLWPWDDATPLYLRVNDPSPTGRGRFVYRCRIWGIRALDDPGVTVTCATRMHRLTSSGKVVRELVRIGGLHADGTPWHVSIPRAISLIEDEARTLIVGAPPQGLRVVGVAQAGVVTKYLRAQADMSSSNELTDVLRCTHPFP